MFMSDIKNKKFFKIILDLLNLSGNHILLQGSLFNLFGKKMAVWWISITCTCYFSKKDHWTLWTLLVGLTMLLETTSYHFQHSLFSC